MVGEGVRAPEDAVNKPVDSVAAGCYTMSEAHSSTCGLAPTDTSEELSFTGNVRNAVGVLPQPQATNAHVPNRSDGRRTSHMSQSSSASRSRSLLHTNLRDLWKSRLPSAFKSKIPQLRRMCQHTNFTFDEVLSMQRSSQEREVATSYIIMPGSLGITLWRGLMTLAVLWAVSVTPVELAFPWWVTPAGVVLVGKLVDALCILDMLLTFNIAKLDHGRVCFNRKVIAKGYLKTWFFVDVLTNFPWDLIWSSKSGLSRKVAKILKLPKLFRVIRLLRVAQEEAYYFGSLFSLGAIVFLAHYSSCLFAWLMVDCGGDEENQGIDCPDILAAYSVGLSTGMATIGGSDAWLRFIVNADRSMSDVDSNGSKDVYAWKLPPNVGAELSATAMVLAGFCAVAMLFANVSHTVSKSGAHCLAFNERLSNLKAASHQHHIPKDLYARVKHHFHYVWCCGSDASRALLRDNALTVDLRRQLALCFYGHSLRQVPFLASCDEGFLKQLCERVEMECFSPQDHIIVAGETGTEFYFLVVGRMRIELPDGGGVLKVLHEGSFFGEMGLLFPDTTRTVSVIAETFGWVLIIDRVALKEICTEELLDTFRSVAKERFDKNPGTGIRPPQPPPSPMSGTRSIRSAESQEPQFLPFGVPKRASSARTTYRSQHVAVVAPSSPMSAASAAPSNAEALNRRKVPQYIAVVAPSSPVSAASAAPSSPDASDRGKLTQAWVPRRGGRSVSPHLTMQSWEGRAPQRGSSSCRMRPHQEGGGCEERGGCSSLAAIERLEASIAGLAEAQGAGLARLAERLAAVEKLIRHDRATPLGFLPNLVDADDEPSMEAALA